MFQRLIAIVYVVQMKNKITTLNTHRASRDRWVQIKSGRLFDGVISRATL